MKHSNKWKVVFIDDEEDIRDVISLVLKDAGYTVFTASDGIQGLKLCDSVNPQIVITDIRMPGIDGLQVIEHIKKNYLNTEVIVITAFGEIELAIRALQLDASDFITKPIDENVLMVSLKRAQERFTSRKKIRDYTVFLEQEQKQTAEELIKTYLFQKNLIESSMDGILACDEHDYVITFNRSMEQFTGYRKHRVLHKTTYHIFFQPGEDETFKQLLSGEQFGGKDKLYLYETTLVPKNGHTIPVQITATVLQNDNIKSGFVCFVRDLREIRKLERELSDQATVLHQDKMMSLGRLSASVVHEINNPLFGMLNYIRLMTRIMNRGEINREQSEKFKKYLDIIEKETDNCTRILSGLLSFSRRSEPCFSQVRIDDLLNKCILLSQHKLELSNIQLIYRKTSGIPQVEGDFNQLQQCLINLIFNAIDAMKNGGTLNLRADYKPAKKRVIITVKDSGYGISEKDLPHIFEPFYTTKKEGYGVGLGLSTVSGIMEYHKGSVKAESTPGKGTTFMLYLPV